MKPEKAVKIIDTLNTGPASPFNKRQQKNTYVQEITPNGILTYKQTVTPYGNLTHRQGLGDSIATEAPTRKPGELIVITSENSGIAHKLGVLAELGYLSDGSQITNPDNDNPSLELISHTSGPGLAEAVFKDHNPKA